METKKHPSLRDQVHQEVESLSEENVKMLLNFLVEISES